MALKQLKHSMIIEGIFYSFGTVLDENKIPSNFRKAKYLIEPEPEEEIDEDIIDEFNEEVEFVDEVGIVDDDSGGLDLEEESKPAVVSKKRKLR